MGLSRNPDQHPMVDNDKELDDAMNDDDTEGKEIDPRILEMHTYAEEGKVADALRLLDEGLHPDVRGPDQDTPLHIACLYGQEYFVDLLLQRSADVNTVDEDLSTPLHNASAGGFASIVKKLLDARATVSVIDSDGESPLHVAANGDHAEVK